MGTMPALPSAPFFWSLAQRASARYCPQAAEQDVSSPRFLRLMSSLLRNASELLGVCPTEAQILSAGMRSVVIRVCCVPGTAHPQPGVGPSFILKHFRRKDSASNSGGFGYLREKHGLTTLSSLVPGTYPALYAADDTARLLVLEDIGSGVSGTDTYSLHHLLASSDSQDRACGVSLYLTFWASVIDSPAQEEACTNFARALGSADPVAQRPGSFPTANMVRQGVESWMIQQQINEHIYPRATTRLKQDIERFLYPPREDAVLTPGDFSPRNLFFFAAPNAHTQPSPSSIRCPSPTLRGIDAEGTSIHHRALPFAELSLGFPTSPHAIAYEGLRQDMARNIYQKHVENALHSAGVSPHSMMAAQLVTGALARQFDTHSV